jgi:hypothetical protein
MRCAVFLFAAIAAGAPAGARTLDDVPGSSPKLPGGLRQQALESDGLTEICLPSALAYTDQDGATGAPLRNQTFADAQISGAPPPRP